MVQQQQQPREPSAPAPAAPAAGAPAAAGAARPRRWTKGKYVPRRKVCAFCRDKIEVIDYKDGPKLTPFISDRGKIEPRRRTGTCARHQRLLAEAIKRARHLALLPFVPTHIRKTGGVGVRSGGPA